MAVGALEHVGVRQTLYPGLSSIDACAPHRQCAGGGFRGSEAQVADIEWAALPHQTIAHRIWNKSDKTSQVLSATGGRRRET